MYVPSYLELLDRSGTVDGWPSFVDDKGKEFAVDQLKLGFEKYGEMDLDLARRCIFEAADQPDCLREIKLWDAIYAVTYRALLEAGAETVWKLRRKI